MDTIEEEILKLKNPFVVKNLNYYDDDDVIVEKIVIGIVLSELDYGEFSSLKEVDDIDEKRKLFIDNFGVEPKLYYYFQASY